MYMHKKYIYIYTYIYIYIYIDSTAQELLKPLREKHGDSEFVDISQGQIGKAGKPWMSLGMPTD